MSNGIQKVRPIDYNVNKLPIDKLNPSASYDTTEGLVARYDFKDGDVSDVSGNENVLTINRKTTIKDGVYLNGSNYFTSTPIIDLGSSGYTIMARFKITNTDTSSGNNRAIVAYSTMHYLRYEADSNRIRLALNDGTTTKSILYNIGEIKNKELVIADTYNYDTNTTQLWVNGVMVSENVGGAFNRDDNRYKKIQTIGSRSGADLFIGNMNEIYFYNELLSDDKIKEYHNNYANEYSLYEDFRYDPVGTIPKEWQQTLGSYEVKEDEDGKYIQCISDGMIKIQDKEAYGTWEFGINKVASSTCDIRFIYQNDTEAYTFRILNNERVSLVRSTTSAYLFYTEVDYINLDTWYMIKITRDLKGTFSCYIKGDDFGDEYVLVEITGDGLGTNPVVNNLYTKNDYMNLMFDGISTNGDAIRNITHKKGIEI